MTSSHPPYESHLSFPYTTPLLPLRTLDIHTPTIAPTSPAYNIVYIHGGAFRDPLVTSRSLLPSLPHIFPQTSATTHIASLSSLNYRLSPYPTHPTHPSTPDDEARNAQWPTHLQDVRAALRWLYALDSQEEDRERYPILRGEYIVIGHSVGATLAFALALGLDEDEEDDDYSGGSPKRPKLKAPKAVVGLEGIYDFAALRDAHLGYRDIYEMFTEGAFGREEDGGWERGNLREIVEGGKVGKGLMEGTDVVVLGQSKEDELVEWGQAEGMEAALIKVGWKEGDGRRCLKLVELEGQHDEIWEKGVELARCVRLVLDHCIHQGLSGGT